MTDGSSETRGRFVPVGEEELLSLGQKADDVAARSRDARAAVVGLVELAEDFRTDAVRRLRERGASEAQVERYEAAYRAQATAAREAVRAIEAAAEALAEEAARLERG